MFRTKTTDTQLPTETKRSHGRLFRVKRVLAAAVAACAVGTTAASAEGSLVETADAAYYVAWQGYIPTQQEYAYGDQCRYTYRTATATAFMMPFRYTTTYYAGQWWVYAQCQVYY